ncbi:hypothetical protein P3C58_05580 [Mesorhizobium sp. XAP10]|uniref:hypothetical protein n=1 Tax=unclassified Mesorhizobium TaxID=325217 RepID=UPI0023DF9FF0|nr:MULTISPECIES: hypothetical protein [unclassified Mesorhizobium]MDF3151445.1 hypothetical protein [Mesorhizobium sp. XAP10]MDF3244331.1 hypothetical protein [Mesorhizobium sp. XAP4]
MNTFSVAVNAASIGDAARVAFRLGNCKRGRGKTKQCGDESRQPCPLQKTEVRESDKGYLSSVSALMIQALYNAASRR